MDGWDDAVANRNPDFRLNCKQQANEMMRTGIQRELNFFRAEENGTWWSRFGLLLDSVPRNTCVPITFHFAHTMHTNKFGWLTVLSMFSNHSARSFKCYSRPYWLYTASLCPLLASESLTYNLSMSTNCSHANMQWLPSTNHQRSMSMTAYN